MALLFDGDNDRIIVNDATFLQGLSALTFSTWIKCNATLPYDIGFFKTNVSYGSDNGIGIRYDITGASSGNSQCLKCGISIGGKECQIETTPFTQTNDWQFVVMTWASPDPIEVYIDGEFNVGQFQINVPHSGVTGPASSIVEILFGTGAKASATTGWDGDMEDVRFYDRKLSPQEIITMYNTRGNDNINNGLLFRLFFQGQPNGTVATINDISDISGNVVVDTIGGNPRFDQSPGFASRRSSRNN